MISANKVDPRGIHNKVVNIIMRAICHYEGGENRLHKFFVIFCSFLIQLIRLIITHTLSSENSDIAKWVFQM